MPVLKSKRAVASIGSMCICRQVVARSVSKSHIDGCCLAESVFVAPYRIYVCCAWMLPNLRGKENSMSWLLVESIVVV